MSANPRALVAMSVFTGSCWRTAVRQFEYGQFEYGNHGRYEGPNCFTLCRFGEAVKSPVSELL